MPLVFSPLSESILDSPPKKLLPRHAFVMRQLGEPPPLDLEIFARLTNVFSKRHITVIDADATTGSKDYLARILELIRCTGFTFAVFSDETRSNSMSNIALELRFAAMCGKPLIIAKSKGALAPSDLKRTDWIDFERNNPSAFDRKLSQALDEVDKLGELEHTLLTVAVEARSPDCAIALERAIKGYLISGEQKFVMNARKILRVLEDIDEKRAIADLERLRTEIKTFIYQAEQNR